MALDKAMHERSTLKIGVAQTQALDDKLDAGFEKHRKMIEAARREDIEVLLFPELSLSGHGIGPGFLEMALSRDDPRILELAGLAGDMVAVFGLKRRWRCGAVLQFRRRRARRPSLLRAPQDQPRHLRQAGRG